MYQGYNQVFDAADILFGNFIKYDRMYEMTKYAFYGKTDSNDVNVYIDIYSLLKNLYSRRPALQLKDSYVIASCLINLAIHIRAYFETRHRVYSKIYLVYGGARPREAFVNYYKYNEKNILMEDSDFPMKSLIADNLAILDTLCPYLHDIFFICDEENEFSVIASSLISQINNKAPNIIYSKEPLAYQLVAYKPWTFLYRPKKSMNQDVSWVVTKSNIYQAYRQGELKLKKDMDIQLDETLLSIYQAITGVRSRGMNSIKNANSTITLLSNAIRDNMFANGFNSHVLLNYEDNSPFEKLFNHALCAEINNRFAAIDLQYQTFLYSGTPNARELLAKCINLYDPDSVRAINDKYFRIYPLDLNRV